MKKKKVLKLLGPIALVASLLLNFFLFLNNRLIERPEEFLVSNVLDGDTFVVSKSQKVRLLEIDSPELDSCGGPESKQRLEQLILNRKVLLSETRADQYGRILALVYLDKTLINETMVAEGWSEYSDSGSSKKEKLKEAGRQAKEKKIGIYDSKCYQTENLENPSCLIKGNINVNTKSKIYFFPGCPNYNQTIVEKFRNDQWFCTEKEAQEAGFKKSGDCFDKTFE